jgi:hypothetical protein
MTASFKFFNKNYYTMMLITWSTYFEAIAILLVIYYAGIFFVFYRKDIPNSLSLKSGAMAFYNEIKASKNHTDLDHPGLPDQLYDEIKAILVASNNANLSKETLLFNLQQLLSNERFRHVTKTTFQNMINDFIVQHCINICSIHLSGEDMEVLWI